MAMEVRPGILTLTVVRLLQQMRMHVGCSAKSLQHAHRLQGLFIPNHLTLHELLTRFQIQNQFVKLLVLSQSAKLLAKKTALKVYQVGQRFHLGMRLCLGVLLRLRRLHQSCPTTIQLMTIQKTISEIN
jgi:hypothetical protein